ncbi:DUF4136 domain-containing protein [Sphingomonas sp. BIUV-7]|uniref:DUF4136 domain-containing protein n=2 Tax=Sphingomonas natans TaxID=3063330 RepID=A0ABT8YB36_9SPHN|nr:DUF4136 domain-containing protein [Sphingomonas sp. BIUV-7]MDO6415536.1 DUF4136 domain-containing protein [Sphingomonas sp. BIUV-7]
MRLKPLAAAVAVLALAGCATTPSTRVTRFHLGQPIARGEIAVEPLVPADRDSLEYQTYASIVGAELAKIGFSEAPGLKQSEQVAVVSVERGSRETLAQRSPVSVGVGGSTGGYGGGGVGLGISFPIGKKRSNEIVMTRLSVQIKRRSEGTVIWEGRAESSAAGGSAAAEPGTTVKMLASALFRDFPGVSGRTITVK